MPYVSVHIAVEDVLDDMDDEVLQKELETRMKRKGTGFELIGEGDATHAQYVERAFLAAKRMDQVPREIADMFWHVHGRALP